MKKVLVASVLSLVLALSIAPTAAFAHTHIDLPNGECIDIPDSQEGNAHDGIGTAKANEGTPFEGGWCPED